MLKLKMYHPADKDITTYLYISPDDIEYILASIPGDVYQMRTKSGSRCTIKGDPYRILGILEERASKLSSVMAFFNLMVPASLALVAIAMIMIALKLLSN